LSTRHALLSCLRKDLVAAARRNVSFCKLLYRGRVTYGGVGKRWNDGRGTMKKQRGVEGDGGPVLISTNSLDCDMSRPDGWACRPRLVKLRLVYWKARHEASPLFSIIIHHTQHKSYCLWIFALESQPVSNMLQQQQASAFLILHFFDTNLMVAYCT